MFSHEHWYKVVPFGNPCSTVLIMSGLIWMTWSVFLMNVVGLQYFHKGHILLLEKVRSAFHKELQFHCSSCTHTVPLYWYSKMYFVGLSQCWVNFWCPSNLFFTSDTGNGCTKQWPRSHGHPDTIGAPINPSCFHEFIQPNESKS